MLINHRKTTVNMMDHQLVQEHHHLIQIKKETHRTLHHK